MSRLRRCGLAALAVLGVGCVSAAPAQAYYGGYGYRGFGPGFGVGLAVGGLYGGFYPRPYGYYPPPVYAVPPVVYAPPPVYLSPPPLTYEGPPPRPRRIVHRVRRPAAATLGRCLPPLPSAVPAPLRDAPSPGP